MCVHVHMMSIWLRWEYFCLIRACFIFTLLRSGQTWAFQFQRLSSEGWRRRRYTIITIVFHYYSVALLCIISYVYKCITLINVVKWSNVYFKQLHGLLFDYYILFIPLRDSDIVFFFLSNSKLIPLIIYIFDYNGWRCGPSFNNL